MPAIPPSFDHAVSEAIERGSNALLGLQDVDGFWREFNLQAGEAEAWVTAWVGWCLIGVKPSSLRRRLQILQACRSASAALLSQSEAGGWGYNRRTGPDADTTAWVLRFLSACGYRVAPAKYLARYIDPGGGVHTFLEPDYGAWTDAHDDVAANAGLALVAEESRSELRGAVRQRLEARFPGKTYWWSTPDYGFAWILRCLAQSGCISDRIAGLAARWIANQPARSTGFEIAHRLVALSCLGVRDSGSSTLANDLLDLAGPEGWPGSAFLLVPRRDGGNPPPPNAELRGIMTTSLCVRVLSEWLARRNKVEAFAMA